MIQEVSAVNPTNPSWYIYLPLWLLFTSLILCHRLAWTALLSFDPSTLGKRGCKTCFLLYIYFEHVNYLLFQNIYPSQGGRGVDPVRLYYWTCSSINETAILLHMKCLRLISSWSVSLETMYLGVNIIGAHLYMGVHPLTLVYFNIVLGSMGTV